ncbi:MAG: hypothetical protein RLZZ436_3505 [Planctomycetota bacterium]|jgi:hypothetical protein
MEPHKPRHPRFLTADPPIRLLIATAAVIIGFQIEFFRQPLESTSFTRADLWLEFVDTLLGLAPPAAAEPAPESGLRFIPQRIPHILRAAALLATAWIHGRAVTRHTLRCLQVTLLERCVLTIAAGLAILSLTVLLTGLAGWIAPAALAAPLAISIPLNFLPRISSPPPPATDTKDLRAVRWIPPAVLMVAIPFSLCLLWGAMTPQTDFDVREYHLQGPKEWFQEGRISCLRHNVYTSFPFFSEMLCLAGMAAADDWRSGALTGQLLLASFQLLTAASVFSIARRWLGSTPAWLALLIHLTAPWTFRISLIAYAEGALTFYLTISVMLTLLLRGHGELAFRAEPQLLSGFLAGCGMACKYTGLVLVVLPVAGFWVWQQWQMRRHSPQLGTGIVLRGAAAFLIGTCIAVGPWLLRNLSDTGNPVYPLAYSIFESNDWNAPLDIRWKAAHSASEHSLLLIPRHLLDAALRNTWTSSLIFGLSIPAALLLHNRSGEFRTILLFACWGLFTWWAFTHRIDRFWIPMIPLLSISGAALWLLSSRKTWRGLLIAICATATLWNLLFCSLPLVGFNAGLMDLETATSRVTRSDIALLNEQLPEDAKVLMVGEAEVFDAEFSLIYNTVFDDSLFETLAAAPDGQPPGSRRPLRPAAEFLENCRREQITHVFVNWSEILRYRLPGSYGYSEFVQPVHFEELTRQNALLPPAVLIRRDWTALAPAEREEVLRWENGSGLVRNNQFHAVLLYRLPPAGP